MVPGTVWREKRANEVPKRVTGDVWRLASGGGAGKGGRHRLERKGRKRRRKEVPGTVLCGPPPTGMQAN